MTSLDNNPAVEAGLIDSAFSADLSEQLSGISSQEDINAFLRPTHECIERGHIEHYFKSFDPLNSDFNFFSVQELLAETTEILDRCYGLKQYHLQLQEKAFNSYVTRLHDVPNKLRQLFRSKKRAEADKFSNQELSDKHNNSEKKLLESLLHLRNLYGRLLPNGSSYQIDEAKLRVIKNTDDSSRPAHWENRRHGAGYLQTRGDVSASGQLLNRKAEGYEEYIMLEQLESVRSQISSKEYQLERLKAQKRVLNQAIQKSDEIIEKIEEEVININSLLSEMKYHYSPGGPLDFRKEWRLLSEMYKIEYTSAMERIAHIQFGIRQVFPSLQIEEFVLGELEAAIHWCRDVAHRIAKAQSKVVLFEVHYVPDPTTAMNQNPEWKFAFSLSDSAIKSSDHVQAVKIGRKSGEGAILLSLQPPTQRLTGLNGAEVMFEPESVPYAVSGFDRHWSERHTVVGSVLNISPVGEWSFTVKEGIQGTEELGDLVFSFMVSRI